MKCLWCNFETTKKKELQTETIKYANLEHIFPECVGGKETLEQGKVCEDCNNRLGKTDEDLKRQNFMMMKQYQDSTERLIDSGAQKRPVGKKGRNKEDKERKKSEMLEMSGYSGGTTIKRNSENTNHIKLINLPVGSAGDAAYNTKFSKALHKCAINVLLDEKSYEYLNENYKDLIDFVNNPENTSYDDWSYATCYAGFFSKIHFEPFCLQKIEVEGIVIAAALIFPCAIFIVCTKPNILDVTLLNIIGSNPPELKNWEESNFLEHFSNVGFGRSRKTFGSKLQFTLIKKEIDGKPNPNDSFYLLTKCKTCGQTNPTGIMLDKKMVLGKVSGLGSGSKNSWNYHLKEDLDILAPGIKFADSIVKDLETTYGINYPPENDVKKMNISNVKVNCINCRETITFDAKDCFV